jgi:hypothetical protein
LWGLAGAEPCPACCQKLIAALEQRDAKTKAGRGLEYLQTVERRNTEIDRLKAKVNRLLRKLAKNRGSK